MDCNDLRARLIDHLYGELPEEEDLLLRQHQEECQDCRRRIDELKADLALYRREPKPLPPAGAVQVALQAARNEALNHPAGVRTSLPLAKWKKILFHPAIAAAALLAVTSILVMESWESNEEYQTRTRKGFASSKLLKEDSSPAEAKASPSAENFADDGSYQPRPILPTATTPETPGASPGAALQSVEDPGLAAEPAKAVLPATPENQVENQGIPELDEESPVKKRVASEEIETVLSRRDEPVEDAKKDARGPATREMVAEEALPEPVDEIQELAPGEKKRELIATALPFTEVAATGDTETSPDSEEPRIRARSAPAASAAAAGEDTAAEAKDEPDPKEHPLPATPLQLQLRKAAVDTQGITGTPPEIVEQTPPLRESPVTTEAGADTSEEKVEEKNSPEALAVGNTVQAPAALARAATTTPPITEAPVRDQDSPEEKASATEEDPRPAGTDTDGAGQPETKTAPFQLICRIIEKQQINLQSVTINRIDLFPNQSYEWVHNSFLPSGQRKNEIFTGTLPDGLFNLLSRSALTATRFKPEDGTPTYRFENAEVPAAHPAGVTLLRAFLEERHLTPQGESKETIPADYQREEAKG